MRFVHLHEDRRSRSYAPSFFEAEGGKPYISRRHEQAEQLVTHIRGKLEPADHFKLYEAGYFARGRVLEIGRLHGKSTVLIALGLEDAGTGYEFVSVESEDRYLPWAERHLKEFGLKGRVRLLQGDSSSVIRGTSGLFDTVFVDGDHSYDGVHRDIDALRGRLEQDAVVMFHDYFHADNDSGAYGVRRAVDETAHELGLVFRGRFGGIAMFERSARPGHA